MRREPRAAAEKLRVSLRESMSAYYEAVRIGLGDTTQIDELYWKLWEVSDGMQAGDEAVNGLIANAGMLRPPRPGSGKPSTRLGSTTSCAGMPSARGPDLSPEPTPAQ